MLGIVVLTVTVAIPLQQQQAEAAPGGFHGCTNTTSGGYLPSKGRCFHP
jgi:hypothetical protein